MRPWIATVAAAGLACASMAASANTYDKLGVDAVIDQTPQIEKTHPQPPGEKRYTYYRVKGTRFAGYVVPGEVQDGTLAGNRQVLVVPLESLGTGGSFAALVWSGTPGNWQYAGYIPAPDGGLRWWIEAGYVQVLTPVYKLGDANCCPSEHRHTRYTVVGTKVAPMSSRIVLRGERFPAWMYIAPGARAFLGTDGEDAPVAIVCRKPGAFNDTCTSRDEGTPIVIDAIASNDRPCSDATQVMVHAANGAWKGYVGIDAVQAPIPPGTLLELKSPPDAEAYQLFAKERKTPRASGAPIDAILRVVRFDPRTNDPSGSTPDTLVTVVSGPRAGSQGWVFAGATTLKDYWVPPNMVCKHDGRALSL